MKWRTCVWPDPRGGCCGCGDGIVWTSWTSLCVVAAVVSSLGSGRTQCTSFTRCGPPLCGKPACREGRDDCRGCCDALTCSRLSALCLSLSCGSYFRRLSARALGRGVRRLILAAYYGGLLGNGPGNLGAWSRARVDQVSRGRARSVQLLGRPRCRPQISSPLSIPPSQQKSNTRPTCAASST